MELTQTLNQKETAQLLSGFLGNLKSREKPVILYKYIGIKLDKPFFMDIHEGSFTPKTLLKKYPLSDNQMMFIFVLSERYVPKSLVHEPCFKVTGVTTNGRIFTSNSKHNDILNYLKSNPYYPEPCIIFANRKDFGNERNIAEKTLIVIADKDNIIPACKRHIYKDLDYTIPAHEGKEPFEARVTSVHKGKLEVIRFIISGRDKYKVSTVRSTYLCNYYNIDPSGYNTEYFKQQLLIRLKEHKNNKNISELVSTDYTSDINRLLDEIILLKNMTLAELMNITNKTDSIFRLVTCVTSSYYVIDDIQELTDKLKVIRDKYNNRKYNNGKYDTEDIYYYNYWTPKLVEHRLELIMKSISKIKKELFNELKKSDI